MPIVGSISKGQRNAYCSYISYQVEPRSAIRCDEDPEIRAVVISAKGKMFCAGGDLKAFAAQGERMPLYMKELTTYFHAAVSRLNRMDPPVIVAVNGMAAGAGMSLVCACDIVFATESARFTMAYTRSGLTPDGSSTYFYRASSV